MVALAMLVVETFFLQIWLPDPYVALSAMTTKETVTLPEVVPNTRSAELLIARLAIAPNVMVCVLSPLVPVTCVPPESGSPFHSEQNTLVGAVPKAVPFSQLRSLLPR